MTFQIQAETQAELTAKSLIAEAVLGVALESFSPEMFRAAQLAEALIDLNEDYGGDWHLVLGDSNVNDECINLCLNQIDPSRGNEELGREFGALMLSMDEEARERVLDLAHAVATKVSLQSAANAVYEALKGAGVLP